MTEDGMVWIDCTAFYNSSNDARHIEWLLDKLWSEGGVSYSSRGLNMYADNWEFITSVDVATNELRHHIKVCSQRLEQLVRGWVNV